MKISHLALFCICLIYTIQCIFSMEKLPEDFTFLDISDKISDVFELTYRPYIGTLPPGTDLLIASLFKQSIISQHLNPVLVKIVGPSAVGKTTLIRSIAQKIISNKNSYLEINLPELLSSPAQKDFYKIDPEKYVESLIKNFYEPIRLQAKTQVIVAFTNSLRLKGNDFKKLRSFLLNIQMSAAPLLVLHEAKKRLKNDGNYHDTIIYIKKPSLEHIKDLLGYTFSKYKYDYEVIKDETIKTLEGSLPPHIERIAEQVLRNAQVQNRESITNKLIQETLHINCKG